MRPYRKDFDETKYMPFLMKDDKLLEKYNEIWEKVKNPIKKEFDSEPVYNEKYLKAKIKSYNGKIDINIYNNKISKEGSQFICLLLVLIASVFRTGKKLLSSSVFIDDIEISYEKILMKKIKKILI